MNPTITTAPIQHIVLDDQGRPYIEGTRIKVVELMSIGLANGWAAEELFRQYPHLSLAQVHAALSYYYDHQAAMDHEIERIDREYQEHRDQSPESPLGVRLRDRSAGVE